MSAPSSSSQMSMGRLSSLPSSSIAPPTGSTRRVSTTVSAPSSQSQNGSNPASALVASTRPPLPLTPRLTTSSTSQNPVQTSTSASASQPPLSSHQPRSQSHFVRSQPRHLFPRAPQSTATQALNFESSPTTGRFAAYVRAPPESPRQRTFRGRVDPNSISGPIRLNQEVGHTNFILEQEDPKFEVHSCFRADADFPGDVVVRCASVEFRVHKAILFFASPFFRSVLEGDWKESHPSLYEQSSSEAEKGDRAGDGTDDGASFSSEEEFVATVPPEGNADGASSENDDIRSISEILKGRHFKACSPRASFHTAFLNLEVEDEGRDLSVCEAEDVPRLSNGDKVVELSHKRRAKSWSEPCTPNKIDRCNNTIQDLAGRLQRLATPPLMEEVTSGEADDLSNAEPHIAVKEGVLPDSAPVGTPCPPSKKSRGKARRKNGRYADDVTAVIELQEEDASTFQDVLCHVYPHLDLRITWYNIFPLLAFSDKFAVPHLRQSCCTFLRAALAGRPIDAMALGERHGIDDVYKEASRHVLDNMTQWEPGELELLLSKETLLKLERKRTWFLERLLKLGLANPLRDYECHATCPDPQACARALQERWQTQYVNAFKFGPPQPSVIWRHMRELESFGNFSTPHTSLSACQNASKAWVHSLFDRMYGLPTHGKTNQKFLWIKLSAPNEEASKNQSRPRPWES